MTDTELRKFWELEEISWSRLLTPEKEKCEKHFLYTHSRPDQGRYVVKLPFLEDPTTLDSKNAAMSRLCSIERALIQNPALYQLYSQFMQEYSTLGHMSKVFSSSLITDTGYVLSHHGVFKSTDKRKIRVVLDASQPTTNGKSLNDYFYTGPKLQTDIFTILLRWRNFKYRF